MQAMAMFLASGAVVLMIAVNLPDKKDNSTSSESASPLESSTASGVQEETNNLSFANSWGDLISNGLNAWTTWYGNSENPSFSNEVFSIIDHEGKSTLKVSGKAPGALISKKNYHNYHFSAKFLLNSANEAIYNGEFPDSGVLIHANGRPGDILEYWMTSLEYQLSTGRFSEARFLNTQGKIPTIYNSRKPNSHRFNPDGELAKVTSFASAPEKTWIKIGDWNTIDIYAIGSTAVYKLNGKVTMIVKELRTKSGGNQRLITSGKIVLQSVKGQFLYQDINIERIKNFPSEIEGVVNLAD